MVGRIGVDTGGTFTDCVIVDPWDGSVRIAKVPSRPDNPRHAVESGVLELLDGRSTDGVVIDSVVHGTTVATNAAIAGDLASVGLITNRGFRDVIEIGTQMRPRLYDLKLESGMPLVPRQRRLEISGRTAADGEEIDPYDLDEAVRAVDELVASGVDSIAIGLLFSFLYPERELEIERAVTERHPDVYAGASSQLSGEPREFSRFATAVINAALAPKVKRYIDELSGWVKEGPLGSELLLMLSSGGVSTPARSGSVGAHQLILSGPAAGVIGGTRESLLVDRPDCVTLDVGGTSADIAVIVGGQSRTGTTMDLPIGLPCDLPHIEMETIGAGGGSIARVDGGGALTVGPQSAGADPGPACYGRGGEEPTITDAQLVAGHLSPDGLLGGGMHLDADLAKAAVARVGEPLGLTVEEAALGIISLMQQNMVGAFQAAAARHGDDLRRFTLVAGGGGGPLHAVALAEALEMRDVIVPPRPGLLSAIGLLGADIRLDFSASLLSVAAEPSLELAEETLGRLRTDAEAVLSEDGVEPAKRRYDFSLDVRYVGQEYALRIPITPGEDDIAAVRERFYERHEQTFGHSSREAATELVTARVAAFGIREAVATPLPTAAAEGTARGSRRVLLDRDRGWCECAVYDRDDLALDQAVAGPCVIAQFDSTTLIPPGWTARVHATGTLIIERAGS